jgi:diacylglycerol kinase family enzyme
MSTTIDVIATTVSGSIRDWGKVKRIEPLFAEHGFDDLHLHVVDSHAAARERTLGLLTEGRRLLISAGGSGTFNAVLEGCCDSRVPLGGIRLGFLRKGSADLIGKTLGMPDEIEAAVKVFAESIRAGHVISCDVLAARASGGGAAPRHFVGYGGAGIFGRIPHYTENRLMKWYKGVLSQVFGDLGPFTTGMTLALLEKMLQGPLGRREWRILVDGQVAAAGRYQALIVVNGYLGSDLPYSDDDLGSGRFHLFALRDLGSRSLLGQARRARDGSIMRDPARWGMEHIPVEGTLTLESGDGAAFPFNVDGSTLACGGGAVTVQRVDSISLIARLPIQAAG